MQRADGAVLDRVHAEVEARRAGADDGDALAARDGVKVVDWFLFREGGGDGVGL
jgi:predicted metalloprotease with PDZ domain